MCEATTERVPDDAALKVYLLGTVDFTATLRLQRRMVYDVAGERTGGTLILCEHTHAVSIGREGSRSHVGYEVAELERREWPLQWVNRGGGALLHAPGQLAIYPILALDRLGLDLQGYLDRLHDILAQTLIGLDIPAVRRLDRSGVFVRGRMIAQVGVAVRDWVSYFGAALNVDADLEPFRRVNCAGSNELPMTSVQREARTPVRASSVRLRLAEAFATAFGFARTALFHSHPALTKVPASDAAVSSHR